MEQQEKQAIRSQRLRRAVTCLKRKERGGEEQDSEEETHYSPIKSKRAKGVGRDPKKGEGEKEEERSAAGGGFLGSEVIVESPLTSLKDANSTGQGSLSVKAAPHSTTTPPQRVTRSSSGSSGSSGEDSDGGGGEAAMVTARSVFEGSRRGRGGKGARGRGKGRGKKL